MSIDPSVIGLGAGAMPPAAFAVSEPLAAAAGVLAAVLLAALAILWTSRVPLRRRSAMHLRLVRP